MMQLSVTLDPLEVLGIASGATLQEIRTAYREQAKKYHPDPRGDPWAFRILNRSYEVLSTARVAGRVAEEFAGNPAPPRPDAADPVRPDAAPRNPERIRAGIRDEVDDPSRLVDGELLLLRFALDGALDYLLKSADERNLSCCLNVSWPSRSLGRPARVPDEAALVVPRLERAFAPLPRQARAVGSRSRAEEGRFEGWLSFPTAEKAKAAFELLHRALRKQGLGVEQWTREILLERDLA